MNKENKMDKLCEDLEKLTFDNSYLLDKQKEKNDEKNQLISAQLQAAFPNLDKKVLLRIYKKSISIRQGNVQANGRFLESEIETALDRSKISYKTQVSIDKTGKISSLNAVDKKNKCFHIVDIVVGPNIEVGKSIKDFIVISCKTTCRERWTQDNWSLKIKPTKYILCTLSKDYPPSKRFQEGPTRKIISTVAKKRDDRRYKLTYDDLIKEVKDQDK